MDAVRLLGRGHNLILRLPEPDPDGRLDVPVERVGKGAFSVVYRTKTGTPYVYTQTREYGRAGDTSKRLLSELTARGEVSPYLPRVVAVGSEDMRASDNAWYRMPIYRVPLRRADSPEAWDQYKFLKACNASVPLHNGSRYLLGYERMQHLLDCVTAAGAPDGLVRALDLLAGEAANYGPDYNFEFPPRNMATTESGHLILLDVLFDREAAVEAAVNRFLR